MHFWWIISNADKRLKLKWVCKYLHFKIYIKPPVVSILNFTVCAPVIKNILYVSNNANTTLKEYNFKKKDQQQCMINGSNKEA